MQTADSLKKILMLRKTEGRRRRSPQRKIWLDGITDSVDMSLGKFLEIMKGREALYAAVHGVGKDRGTRDQLVNIHCIIEEARAIQKITYFCFIDYAKAFDCVDHNKLWKILKETGIPDHLTCLLRNLYEGQEATIRTGNGTID